MLEQSTLTQPTSAGLIRPLFSLPLKNAQIAQLVEQRIENPRVGGSIPPLGTNNSSQFIPISLRITLISG